MQVPASDVVLPGVAMSGWLSKESDWLRSWNKRWLVLWPVGQPTLSQLTKGDDMGFRAAAEGGLTAHGFWLFLFDSPEASKPRRVVPLQPGTFELTVSDEETGGEETGSSVGAAAAQASAAKRTVLELTVRAAMSSSLLPGRVKGGAAGGTVTLRLSSDSRDTLRQWGRAIADTLAPVRRDRLDSAGCAHRAPITRHSNALRTDSQSCAEKEHGSYSKLLDRLASPPSTLCSVADGPGTGSQIALPVLDFGLAASPSPARRAAPPARTPPEDAADGEKRAAGQENIGSGLRSQKRLRTTKTAGAASLGRSSQPLAESPLTRFRANLQNRGDSRPPWCS